jgi:hypothetical protein
MSGDSCPPQGGGWTFFTGSDERLRELEAELDEKPEDFVLLSEWMGNLIYPMVEGSITAEKKMRRLEALALRINSLPENSSVRSYMENKMALVLAIVNKPE